MTSSYPVYGNLALAPVAAPAPRRFMVIDGSAHTSARKQAVPAQHSVLRSLIAIAVLALVVVGSFVALWTVTGAHASERAALVDQTSFATVRVAEGDSLWSLAETYGIEGLTTQETSDVIREANQLDSATLQPGMELIVPVA